MLNTMIVSRWDVWLSLSRHRPLSYPQRRVSLSCPQSCCVDHQTKYFYNLPQSWYTLSAREGEVCVEMLPVLVTGDAPVSDRPPARSMLWLSSLPPCPAHNSHSKLSMTTDSLLSLDLSSYSPHSNWSMTNDAIKMRHVVIFLKTFEIRL